MRLSGAHRTAVVSFQCLSLRQFWRDSSDRHVRLGGAHRTAVVSFQCLLLRQYWIELDSYDGHVRQNSSCMLSMFIIETVLDRARQLRQTCETG